MSSERGQAPVVISVNDVNKIYHNYPNPLGHLLSQLVGREGNCQSFQALCNVNLQVYRGETLGIIGRNGSGKSTLLQIIAGIMQPSHGSVNVHGRISALLELGAGFSPDFSGLENARLNASIMGLSDTEFERKLPDIEQFCALGEFFYQPVRMYSSGMYVRLAFAVAIHMNPDILIIDEALAVGDVRFQRKCFRRLEELKSQGVSILLVTHSTDSVVNHCDRAILLNNGQVHAAGSAKSVVHQYLEMLFSIDTKQDDSSVSTPIIDINAIDPDKDYCLQRPHYNPSEYRWGDQRARIIDCYLTEDGKSPVICGSGSVIQITMVVYFTTVLEGLIYGCTFKTADGNVIYGTNTRLNGECAVTHQAGDLVAVCFTIHLNLLYGDYFVSLGVAVDDPDKDNIAIDRRYDLLHIRVDQTPDAFGVAQLDGVITAQNI